MAASPYPAYAVQHAINRLPHSMQKNRTHPQAGEASAPSGKQTARTRRPGKHQRHPANRPHEPVGRISISAIRQTDRTNP